MKEEGMKIHWITQRRKVADLKSFEGNPRKATAKDIEDLDKSLERFDVAEPLVINTDGEVIGGNFRLSRLKEKGVEEVDVRVPDRKLNRKEAEELNLRLNKNTASFDYDLLANFSENLLENVGWSSEELDKIFQLDVSEDDFNADEEYGKIKKPTTKLGEIYQLGNHRLWIEIFYKIIKESGFKFLEMICWDKGHALPITSKEGLTRQYEDILFIGNEENASRDLELYFLGRNDKRAYFNKKNQRGITNYWRIGTNKTQIKGNLACFPIALPRKAIELMSDRGDSILDPFGGSGSTLIACEQTNRKCFMMEIDERYCDVIITRWETLTGKKPEKING